MNISFLFLSFPPQHVKQMNSNILPAWRGNPTCASHSRKSFKNIPENFRLCSTFLIQRNKNRANEENELAKELVLRLCVASSWTIIKASTVTSIARIDGLKNSLATYYRSSRKAQACRRWTPSNDNPTLAAPPSSACWIVMTLNFRMMDGIE